MNGSDIETDGAGQQVRILGGQKCGMGSLPDDPGSYTYNIGGTSPGAPITTMVGYNGDGAPPGWTYTKTGQYSLASIPAGEFIDPSFPYIIQKWYGGDIDVARTAGDALAYQVGSTNYTDLTGACTSGYPNSVSGPACTDMGPVNFPANPGDALGFQVINVYRPNNGNGTWETGSATFSLSTTSCFSKNWLQQLGGYNDLVDYHPTGDGICTPAVPTIGSAFQSSGQDTVTVNLNQGQQQTVNFNYSDTGQANSKAVNVQCTTQGVPGGLTVSQAGCPQTTISN